MTDHPTPRVHWWLLAVTMVGLAALLLVAAVTGGTLGEHPYQPGTGDRHAPVPAAVADGGPIIDPHLQEAGARVADRTVALTFDDGPSAYTPRVLQVLERYHVPATFFVVGTHVSQHVGLLRRMVRDGDEIGVHTFTHPDLASIPGWRIRLEMANTQVAIAAATGYTTDLMRPPFSSQPTSLTPADWWAIGHVGNYRVVLTDRDTADWTRPGAATIAAAATPAGSQGAVVMMHDGGGDRSQTVAALDLLVPRLLSRGYRFTTVSHAIGVGSPWVRATTEQQVRGMVVIATVRLADALVWILRVLFFVVGALAVIRVVLLLGFAGRHARRPRWPDDAGPLPAVSVVVPAYNESAGIASCVRSLLACDYPDLEVVVVDDGSTDDTAQIVSGITDPRLRLISQANAGKPAALNTGVAAARADLLVLVDGDTVFERDTLRELVAVMSDPRVGAVSGNTKVGNRRGLIGRWQHVEYVIGFNLDRRMFDLLECMPTVPGAIGAFRRRALADVGGVSADTLAEDTDLTMAICAAGWRVVYAPQARAWTEAPSSVGQLWRQRYRWCYGTMQAIWKHRRTMLARGSAGHLGRRGLPYLLTFQVVLPLLAPVIDVTALFGLFTADVRPLAYTWLAFLGLQLLAAGFAFALDGERLRTLWVLPVQQFVYRQLMYLVVIQSVASAAYGSRLRWHTVRRTGVLESAPPAS